MSEHTIDPTIIHHRWIKSLDPALVIRSGDTVHFDLMVAGDPNIRSTSTAEDAVFDWETIYNLSGPIYIEDAEPGDSLEVRILDVTPRLPYGANSASPTGGALPGVMPRPYSKVYPIDLKRNAAIYDKNV